MIESKGWRPSIGAAAAEYRGFGEPPIFWMLDVVEMLVLPGSDRSGSGQCEVDAVGFIII